MKINSSQTGRKVMCLTSMLVVIVGGLNAKATTYFCQQQQSTYQSSGAGNHFVGDYLVEVNGKEVSITKQGSDSKVIKTTLGEAIKNDAQQTCVESKNKGMCLLGSSDPYELCRNVCTSYGDETSSSIVSQSTDHTALTISTDSSLLYKESTWGGLSSKEVVKKASGKIECKLKDIVMLTTGLNGTNTNSMVLNWAGVPVAISGYAERSTGEFAIARVENGKTSLIKGKDLELALAGQGVSVVDTRDIKDIFDLKTVHEAKCFGRGYNTVETFDYQNNGGQVSVNFTSSNTTRSYLTGSLITINGLGKIARNDQEILSAKVITNSDFALPGLVCHVSK